MSAQNSRFGPVKIWSTLAILISLVLILLRISPLGGPFIFSDEYLYAAWASALYHGSHSVPPLDVALGNWLYLRVYSSVFIGAGSFLVKARVLNAIFSALAAGVLVRAFRTVEPACKQPLATVLAIGFAVALLGTYAGYFIPEASYFAVTCVWFFCATCYARNRRLSLAIAAGIVGGIATMTKGHAILLLPAMLLTFVLSGVYSRDDWRKTILNAIILIAVWLLCCFIISLLFRNDSDLSPVGGFYGMLASGIMKDVGVYLNSAFVKLVLSYAATLVVILGLPLLICYWLAMVALFRPKSSGYRMELLFPALMLCCAITGFLLMASVFTVVAVTPGSVTYDVYHNLGRLDGGRYYEFFALLAACVGIMASRTVLERWSRQARLIVFVLFCVLLAASWWVLRRVGSQYPNDFAIAYGLFASPIGRYCALFLSAVSALLVLLLPKRAPAVLACALLAWLTFNVVRTEQLRWPNQESASGRVAAMVAEAGDSSTTVEIVGSGATVPVYRAAFHLLERHTGLALGNAASTCGVAGRTPDWVIVVDGASDPCGYPNDIRIGDVSASRRVGPSTAVSSPSSGVLYHASLALAEAPRVTADGKNIVMIVAVTNNGHGTFGSATAPNNVNLGAHSIDASGDIVDNDLARGHLPQIAPGATVNATILLPVASTLGVRVELLPVQENVAWFDQWGTKPLIVGPFKACANSGMGKKVCDTSGAPLPVIGKRL